MDNITLGRRIKEARLAKKNDTKRSSGKFYHTQYAQSNRKRNRLTVYQNSGISVAGIGNTSRPAYAAGRKNKRNICMSGRFHFRKLSGIKKRIFGGKI